MESRLSRRGEGTALAALGIILVVTALWWTLALWPMSAAAPVWLLRTREVCFGNPADGLPTPGGWILLIGEPIGMIGTLAAIAWGELARGLRRLADAPAGRLTLGAVTFAVLVGIGAAVTRIRSAGAEAEEPDPRLAVVDRPIPDFRLIDQRGDTVTAATLRGSPVVVGFAFGHCATVCPATVERVRVAVEQSGGVAIGVIVTVDPWRDPPSRLPALASQWRLGDRFFLLSGEVPAVVGALAGWGVRTFRDSLTGDVTHSSLVQVADRGGRVRYLVSGTSAAVSEAVRRAVRRAD